jgi:hypothetical protein
MPGRSILLALHPGPLSICSAEKVSGVAFTSASRPFTASFANPAVTSLLNRSMISEDVPLGAPIPYQELTSYPGTASATLRKIRKRAGPGGGRYRQGSQSSRTDKRQRGRHGIEHDCHGTDGKGKGPVSEQLKVSPSDLTMLARTIQPH